MSNIKYLPLFLFTAYFAKIAVIGGVWIDSVILAVLASTAAFYEFKSQDNKIKSLETRFNELIETSNEQNKKIDEARTSITGIKMSQGLRGNNVNR